ncbi:LptA/OstA family protein [Geminocystis sp. NIES-3708]|uniref:LptA/OstA family protein n=1 Tax=Geminocystis sp. NIES-3708 TaxID=1615909 RepID=UPI000833FA0C
MKSLQMSAKTKKTIYSSLLAISLISPWLITSNFNFNQVKAQSAIPKQPLTVRSDIQEANSETGVITARGNVYINYPARDLQATSTQAQYFSRERRLVLTGNVYVLQQGNTMRSETMTYLIDEGRFIATPETKQQVESVYLVDETENK